MREKNTKIRLDLLRRFLTVDNVVTNSKGFSPFHCIYVLYHGFEPNNHQLELIRMHTDLL